MSSFGPVQTGKPRHGECLYCWDENHTRETGTYFESRVPMVGPVCRHRLKPAKRTRKQFKTNRIREEILNTEDLAYWNRRAWLPKYCGEFGELVLGTPGNLIRIEGMQPGYRKEHDR